jgi:iron complex outermembrane receptor protein
MRFALSVAVLAAISLPLHAQNNDAGVVNANDAVVVNASRFPEDARKLPASVTVLTAEDIARSAAKTLPDLLAEQVGITLKDFFGNNGASTGIDMRGFGITGAQNTLILLDGQRVTDIDLSSVQWSAIPLSSIERIEIQRGTGAVLYGDGASAGVINIITRSPLKQGSSAEFYGRAATYGTQEGQVTGSLVKDNFGINATAYNFRSDGYRANNFDKQANYSTGLRWGFGESFLDLRLAQDHQELRLPGARLVQPSIGLDEYAADRRGTDTPLDYSSRDGHRVALTAAHKLGDADVRIGFDWRDKDARAYFDQGGFPSFRDDALSVYGFTPRVRVPFQLGGFGNSLTVGVDSHRWNYDSRRTTLPEFVNQPTNHVLATQTNNAFYVQDQIQFTPATGLTLGWRTEQVKISASDTLDPTSPGFFFNTAAPPASSDNTQHAWELGLKHAFDAQWSGFARAGRSYRFANVDEIYGTDAFFNAQFHMLRPQHQITNEVGGEWRRGPDSLRAALFITDITDEIHLDPFTPGVGNTNLPPSRRQGLELSGVWQAAESLRLTAGYAYTDARFKQGTFAGAFPPFVNLPIGGKYVPLVPVNKLNLGLAWAAAARTTVSGGLTWQSSQYMDNDEPNTLNTKIPAFTVVDLKAARDLGFGRVALSVNNLFNQQYYTYAVRSNFTADRYAVYPLPGRTLALSLEFKM